MALEAKSFLSIANPDDRTVVAFETGFNNPPGQDFGVGVSGDRCGVFGLSDTNSTLGPFDTRPPEGLVEPGTGVAGFGEQVGVQAMGMKLGLFADGRTDAAVLARNQRPVSHPGPTAAVDAQAEASGTSPESGFGVRAWSKFNRAGVFISGGAFDRDLSMLASDHVVAQIHLVPIESPRPKEGQAGDIMAIQEPGKDEVGLLFCVRSSKPAEGSKPAETAWWRPVQLGPLLH